MYSLLITFFLAFSVIGISVTLLALGWLMTGKSKIRPGACGRDPTKKMDDEDCGKQSSCGLCKKDTDKK